MGDQSFRQSNWQLDGQVDMEVSVFEIVLAIQSPEAAFSWVSESPTGRKCQADLDL